MTLKHLRSSTANKRPLVGAMSEGQIALNTASGSPGLFFEASNATLVKVGPVHIGTTAPNSSPASGGTTGNSIGEQWLDTTGGVYIFKVWDGTAWRSEEATFVSRSGDTMTGPLTLGTASNLVFEGSVDDGFETTLTVVNPTADRTITLPNITGTVITDADTGTVTSTMILDGTIANADINASAAIAFSKLASLTAGQVLLGNSSNIPTATALTGDVTVTSSGVTAISPGVIIDADINASAAIADTKLATISTANKVNISALNVSGATDIGTGLADADLLIIHDSSTGFKVKAAASRITDYAFGKVSGDITVTSNGVASISSGVIVDADINASAAIVDTKLATISTANKVSIVALDIDGGTALGVPLADADLFIVDDGGTGTNRKMVATGISNYVFGKVSGDITTTASGVATVSAGAIDNAKVSATAAIVDTKLATISTANKVSLAALDIDGGTDIGTALADVDLFIVDDGAVGTNRKAAASRISDFVFAKVSGDITTTSAGVASITAGAIVNADVNASAAIAGTKISPDFGSQSINTTGAISGSTFVASGAGAADFIVLASTSITGRTSIHFNTNGNDWELGARATSGTPGNSFYLYDLTAAAYRLVVNNAGSILPANSSSVTIPTFDSTLKAVCYQHQSTDEFASAFYSNFSASASVAPNIALGKSRGALGAQGLVASGDSLGRIVFLGSDGNAVTTNRGFLRAAHIEAVVDSAAGTGTMPGRLVFATTPSGTAAPVERMRINGRGQVAFGGVTGLPPERLINVAVNSTYLTTGASVSPPHAAGLAVTSPFTAGTLNECASFLSKPTVSSGAIVQNWLYDFQVEGGGLAAGSSVNRRTGFFVNGALGGVNGNVGMHINLNDANNVGAYSLLIEGDAQTVINSNAVVFMPISAGGEVTRINNYGVHIGTPTAFNHPARLNIATNSAVLDLATLSAYVGTAASGGVLNLQRSRSTLPDNFLTTVSGDEIAHLVFRADNGTSFKRAASIGAFVDGTVTPSGTDMPGRIAIYTTPDATDVPVERLRITNDGVRAFNQPAPAVKTGTSILTAAELKTGIIQCNLAANATLFLPSGALLEAAFASWYNNMAFEWTIINTSATLVATLSVSSGNTISGNPSVTSNWSNRYLTRRLAANTFIHYRLC